MINPKPYYSPNAPSNTGKIIIIGGFILLAYMLYSLTTSIYKNYLIDQHIANFENRNKLLAEENSKKIQDYEYYTSESYIEKTAKQNLGVMNPKEELIIIPEKKNTPLSVQAEEEKKHQEELQRTPNYQKWWLFFFVENPYK